MGLFDRFSRSKGSGPAIPEAFRPLAEDFAALDNVRSGLAESALRYVAFGDDADVLADVESLTGCALALRLKNADRGSSGGRQRDAFFTAGPTDAATLLRLARLFDSCFRRDTFHRFAPEVPPWFEILLWESFSGRPSSWSSSDAYRLSARTLLECLELDGNTDPSLIVTLAVVKADAAHFSGTQLRSNLSKADGFSEALGRFPAVIEGALVTADATHRCQILEMIGQCDADPTPWGATIVGLAIGSAKTVRRAAAALVPGIDGVVQLLESAFEGGSASERIEAASLLAYRGGERGRQFLATLPNQKSKKLQQHLEGLIDMAQSTDDQPAATLEIPPRTPIDYGPPPTDLVDAFNSMCDEWYERESNSGRSVKPISPRDRAYILRSVADPKPWSGHVKRAIHLFRTSGATAVEPFTKLRESVPLSLLHTTRLMYHLGFTDKNTFFTYRQIKLALAKKGYDLRAVAEALECVEFPRVKFLSALLDGWHTPVYDWGGEESWPLYAENLDAIEAALGLVPDTKYKFNDYQGVERRSNCYDILRHFPVIPEQLLPFLWEVALGTGKTERPLAQRTLVNVPGRDEAIIGALSDGKQDVRAAAARWLAELGVAAAVDPLRAAMKKEKSDVAQAAYLDALELLGASIDEFIDPSLLQEQAAKGLKKGVPKDLAWFDFAALPVVHWVDRSGERGDRLSDDVLRWWIVQSHKLKNPEPSALLTRYFDRLDAAERSELSLNVLWQWIGHDTARPSGIDAATKQQLQGQVAGWQPYHPGKSVQDVYAWLEHGYLNQPTGSAIKQKGLLAVAAAGGAADVVAPIEQYLKNWYGVRAPQSKALLHALAHVNHPSAIQLLLAISVRFRTKGIRQTAEELVRGVAGRRNWTLDELGDRTIPTAGLEDDGTLLLEYGRPLGATDDIQVTRVFKVSLDDTFKPIIIRSDGATIKTLPAATRDEDDEVIKRAKKELSTSKRQLKDVVRMQTSRLFEGMATQRQWRLADWRTYLLSHPIVGRLCQRLIWCVYDGDNITAMFRPLDDGTLTDVEDNDVQLPDDATLRLAHGSQLSSSDEAAWLAHLSDYEISPLFVQLGRAGYALPDDQREAPACADFEGHMTTAFALRRVATKLGYSRGSAEDGGWFYRYEKQFPSLQLEAEIEFTGSSLPEEDRAVALRRLSFSRWQGQHASPVSLGELPPVLLAECWNDLRAIADTGSGFDAEWARKAEY